MIAKPFSSSFILSMRFARSKAHVEGRADGRAMGPVRAAASRAPAEWGWSEDAQDDSDHEIRAACEKAPL
jgi:hypothetical protein